LTADLQQIIHALPTAASANVGAGAGNPGAGAAPRGGDDDEVVDADFTRE
jgi:hypothetical protein